MKKLSLVLLLVFTACQVEDSDIGVLESLQEQIDLLQDQNSELTQTISDLTTQFATLASSNESVANLAEQALQSAQAAATVAEQAIANSEEAQSLASQAESLAVLAGQTAEEASNIASEAQESAETAQENAVQAQTLSTNFQSITQSRSTQQNYTTASFDLEDVDTFPQDGLMRHTTFNNESRHNFSIQYNNSQDVAWVSDRFGESSNAIYMNGDYCNTRLKSSIGNSGIINDEFSLSFWVARYGDGCETPRILDFYSQYSDDTTRRFGIAWPNGENLYGVTIPNGQWTNIIVTFDESATKIYINGNLVNTSAARSLPLINTFSLGAMNHPAYDAFNGMFDDFAYWNRMLNPKEIEYIATH